GGRGTRGEERQAQGAGQGGAPSRGGGVWGHGVTAGDRAGDGRRNSARHSTHARAAQMPKRSQTTEPVSSGPAFGRSYTTGKLRYVTRSKATYSHGTGRCSRASGTSSGDVHRIHCGEEKT